MLISLREKMHFHKYFEEHITNTKKKKHGKV